MMGTTENAIYAVPTLTGNKLLIPNFLKRSCYIIPYRVKAK
ncbi:hypothetical protein C8N37_105462 [Sphingobacterium faecium]|nr:hypothetical protein C8N37_105462 [Sphingobacterium faecium]